MNMSEIEKVRVTWMYDGGGYVYESIPKSLTANDKLETVRFELREIDGEDSNIEIVIQRKDNTYVFKTDYYGDPLEEFPLKLFRSDDEIVLFYDGRYGVAYFHLIS